MTRAEVLRRRQAAFRRVLRDPLWRPIEPEDRECAVDELRGRRGHAVLRYLLVEVGATGYGPRRWYSTWRSVPEALGYLRGQDYADAWDLGVLVDLDTGRLVRSGAVPRA